MLPYRSNREDLVKTVVPAQTYTHTHVFAPPNQLGHSMTRGLGACLTESASCVFCVQTGCVGQGMPCSKVPAVLYGGSFTTGIPISQLCVPII